ncbi:MAG: WD40/YVTN/BNR-like repeat-containing protein [Syntrophothermus sp.]
MRKLLFSYIAIFLFTSVCFSQWFRQPFPSNENLTKVRFVNSTTGWVLTGKSLYKTSDGGTSWVKQDTAVKWGMWSLFPVDTLTAFHSFSLDSLNSPFLGIRKTTDGGNTWFTVDTAKNFYFSRIRFIDPLTGYAAGDSLGLPVIRKTTDGGKSWKSIYKIIRHDNPPVSDYFSGLSFITPSTGWGVTYLGIVAHTSDSGTTWKLQDTLGSVPRATNEVIEDVQFASKDSGWAVGGLRGTSLIYRTTNGGKNWHSLSPQSGSSLQELAVIDSRTVYIVGRNYGVNNIAKTTDGGLTW